MCVVNASPYQLFVQTWYEILAVLPVNVLPVLPGCLCTAGRERVRSPVGVLSGGRWRGGGQVRRAESDQSGRDCGGQSDTTLWNTVAYWSNSRSVLNIKLRDGCRYCLKSDCCEIYTCACSFPAVQVGCWIAISVKDRQTDSQNIEMTNFPISPSRQNHFLAVRMTADSISCSHRQFSADRHCTQSAAGQGWHRVSCIWYCGYTPSLWPKSCCLFVCTMCIVVWWDQTLKPMTVPNRFIVKSYWLDWQIAI